MLQQVGFLQVSFLAEVIHRGGSDIKWNVPFHSIEGQARPFNNELRFAVLQATMLIELNKVHPGDLKSSKQIIQKIF